MTRSVGQTSSVSQKDLPSHFTCLPTIFHVYVHQLATSSSFLFGRHSLVHQVGSSHVKLPVSSSLGYNFQVLLWIHVDQREYLVLLQAVPPSVVRVKARAIWNIHLDHPYHSIPNRSIHIRIPAKPGRSDIPETICLKGRCVSTSAGGYS